MSNADLALRFIRAVEARDADAAFALVRDDVVHEEMPNRLFPDGARRDLQAMREGVARGAIVLARQDYRVDAVVADGDRVAVALSWTGTTAIPIKHLPAGSTLKARIAMAFDFADGRIARIRNYDCYEPF